MVLDIEKEFKDNKTLLLLVPSVEYNHVVVDNMKKLAKEDVCYITLNKTFDSLKEIFEKNKIDISKVVFVDAISKTIKNVPTQTKGCYYLSAPNSLTEISLQVSHFIKHGFDYIVFDSLTNLLIYQKKAPVAKFLSTIINKIADSNTKGVFYSLDSKAHEELIEEASMFVDKVVKVE
jgi:hypothetical protein